MQENHWAETGYSRRWQI